MACSGLSNGDGAGRKNAGPLILAGRTGECTSGTRGCSVQGFGQCRINSVSPRVLECYLLVLHGLVIHRLCLAITHPGPKEVANGKAYSAVRSPALNEQTLGETGQLGLSFACSIPPMSLLRLLHTAYICKDTLNTCSHTLGHLGLKET